jgi:hypothetical protein
MGGYASGRLKAGALQSILRIGWVGPPLPGWVTGFRVREAMRIEPRQKREKDAEKEGIGRGSRAIGVQPGTKPIDGGQEGAVAQNPCKEDGEMCVGHQHLTGEKTPQSKGKYSTLEGVESWFSSSPKAKKQQQMKGTGASPASTQYSIHPHGLTRRPPRENTSSSSRACKRTAQAVGIQRTRGSSSARRGGGGGGR